MVMGGSGKDSVTLRTSVTGKLESVDTGDGDDSVTITGMLRNGGLMVDLGAGNDIYSGRESNAESRIDGGDGTDTLHLDHREGFHIQGRGGVKLIPFTPGSRRLMWPWAWRLRR